MRRALFRTIAAAAGLLALSACTEGSEPGLYTGYVEADLVYIAAPQSGWLVSAPFEEGDDVSRGDLLFALDSDEQRAALAEAEGRVEQAGAQARDLETGARPAEIAALEAQLDEARAQLRLAEEERKRWVTLTERGVASQARADQVIAEHEAARARVRRIAHNIEVAELAGRDAARAAADAARQAATAALAQAHWRLGERQVEARTNGRVEEVFHYPGEFVQAGVPVLAILPPDALKVRFFVPQADLGRVAPGDRVAVTSDLDGAPREATITYVAREAEFTPPVIYSTESREKLVFLVEARLEDPAGLRPGQPVDVRLAAGEPA